MHWWHILLSALAVGVAGAPSYDYTLHEKRGHIPQGWTCSGRLPADVVLPIRIALTQENLDKAEDFLMEVSSPSSKKYGQHWSAKDIAEKFAPSQESVKIVTDWLGKNGIPNERITRSQSLGWLKFHATVAEAENLLKTEYYTYKHQGGKSRIGCTEYHVPERVSRHLDFITPTVHFDTKVSRTVKPLEVNVTNTTNVEKNVTRVADSTLDSNITIVADSKTKNNITIVEDSETNSNITTVEDSETNSNITIVEDSKTDSNITTVGDSETDGNITIVEDYKTDSNLTGTKSAVGVPVQAFKAEEIGAPDSGSLPKKGPSLSSKKVASLVAQKVASILDTCNTRVTIDCLRALYGFGPGISAKPQNSFGIIEFAPQTYLQSDLDLFFSNFSKNQVQRTPILNAINGGAFNTQTKSFNINGEADLDLELGMALVNPQKTTLYQVGDGVQGASFNDFLDALDSSYCTFDGGDDPLQDTRYPGQSPGGFQGPKNCGGFSATKVISSSYVYNEADLTARYERRQCMEYLKLGLAGTTVLFCSGDYGVSGNAKQCIDPVTKRYNSGASGIFNPSFPASCPYVTTVGATQIQPGASVTAPEKACETVIYSGGGFSNVFPIPSYQTNAVQSWFRNHPPPYGADRFNNSQTTRGYPDISANGANIVAAVNGEFTLIYGTSVSTPVVGAIFTLINEARLCSGKSTIGFINPFLYQHPEAFNDITSGSNPGCGTSGFSAVSGWDPVTGLGTPIFQRLLTSFLSMR